MGSMKAEELYLDSDTARRDGELDYAGFLLVSALLAEIRDELKRNNDREDRRESPEYMKQMASRSLSMAEQMADEIERMEREHG